MTKPLFIWAGGKSRMLKHLVPHMPEKIDSYCEPFFGGGAMFIHVMKNHQPGQVSINDINQSLTNIYLSIRDNPSEFCNRIDELEAKYIPLDKPDRKSFYMETRHTHGYDYQQWSLPAEAATLYFLMKTGFNGIYQCNKNTNGRYGTPAGLLNQKLQVYDRDVVKWWNQALQNVKITSKDWRQAVDEAPADSTFFLDPPYRGCFTSYGQTFPDSDQIDLVQWADKQKSVFLCNRETGDSFWENNRGSLNVTHIPVKYTAGRRKKAENGTFSAKSATEIFLWHNAEVKDVL